jgi:choline-sulfatase
MRYKNVLILMADEHSNKVLGCHGHPTVRTPNLDRLAARGTRFANAYTNCPICIPARASFATGRYTFETSCWDNAIAYTGTPPSWGHALREKNVPSYSIGKLHYRKAEDDTGFAEQILPMHVVDGIGDLLGAVRDPLPVRHKSRAVATEIGPGESTYTKYDRDITKAACDWLGNRGNQGPWVLFVSWVAPHFPLIAPKEFYDLYDPKTIPLPKASKPEEWPRHPWLDAFRKCFITDEFFTDETRRIAIAAYYGLVTFMDNNVGQVLASLEESGVADDTLIIYTSDHGDNLGTRGLWGKSTMYEESAAIPMIMAGRDIPHGKVVSTPVSLIDVHPTLMDAFGHAPVPARAGSRCSSCRPAPTTRSALPSPNITPRARPPAPSCCGRAATSTCTTSTCRRSSSISKWILKSSRTSQAIRHTPNACRNFARSSKASAIRRQSTGAPSPNRPLSSNGTVDAMRSSPKAVSAQRRRRGRNRNSNEPLAAHAALAVFKISGRIRLRP